MQGKSMKNRYLYIFGVLAVCMVAFVTPVMAESVKTKAKQVILIDHDTGTVLFEKNADQRMPTSSMSKVMTIYMVFEALKDGQLALDDEMQVSEKAWRKGGSKMFVEVNKRVKVEDLIRGVLVQSGNDATIVLAEGLAGTEKSFAQAITAKAQELGMENSNFMNASGWPDKDHYSTARDLSTLAQAVMTNFSDFYHFFGEKEFTYNNITQKNRNPLLYRGIGADGMKTGHTNIGGYGLIGSGVKNGRRVILVANGMLSEKDRAQESAKLLEWGLRGFKNQTLFKAGDVIEEAEVAMGDAKSVELVTKDDLHVTLPTLSQKGLSVSVKYNGPIQAPIAKGENIATLVLDSPGMASREYPLYAHADVGELGFVAATIEKVKMLLQGKGRRAVANDDVKESS